MESAKVYDPKAEASVPRLRVDHHQRLTLTTPEDSRIMESRDVNVGHKLTFTSFCGRWWHAEGYRQ